MTEGLGWGSRHPLSLTCHCSRSMWEHRTESALSLRLFPLLSLLSWAHPPQPGVDQAGEAEFGSMSGDLCPGVQVQGISICWGWGITGNGGGRSNSHLVEGSSPALGAAHTPHPDVHQRLTVDQTVVQGVHQAHGIFLQDH